MGVDQVQDFLGMVLFQTPPPCIQMAGAPALGIVMRSIFRLDRAMSNSEDRLVHLEARFAWLERHVTDQDKAMADMADEIRRLRREMDGLRERLTRAETAGGEGVAEEPPPPHY
jgi:SlyX protein